MIEDPTKPHVHDQAEIRAGAAMRIDVNTMGGKKILELMEALLAVRMMEIAKADPYCRGLLNTLENVGANVQIAVDKSARLLARAAKGEGT